MSEEGGRDIVLLDGGMGQELMRRSARPPAPLWSADTLAEEPELVTAVHRDFVAAGARVLTTAGYSVTPGRLAKARREAAFETLQAAALTAAAEARAGAAHPVRIAGCLPPLLASYQPFLAPEPAAALAGYRRLVAAQRPGVDLYLGETLPSIAEARAALDAARESGLPVWIAFTVDDADGRRLRSGE
ncbi:MAG: homocysteine S-methyltransferase family protein, partial [Pseudomonadota bacterium]